MALHRGWGGSVDTDWSELWLRSEWQAVVVVCWGRLLDLIPGVQKCSVDMCAIVLLPYLRLDSNELL